MKKKDVLSKTGKQNELTQISEPLNLDISSTLNQEINKVKSDRAQWLQSAEVQDPKKFREIIYDQVLLAFEKAVYPRDISDVCEGLSNLLCRSSIHFGEGEDIFHMLYRLVEIKKDKRLKENELKSDVSNKDYSLSEDYALDSLRLHGVMYCHKKLEEEIKARDLPAALVYIKELERRLVYDIKNWNIDRTILLKATKDYRIAVERAIAQAKEELELRKQLEIKPEETNLDESKAEIEDASAREYKFYLSQKVQAILYLLENAGVNVNEIGKQAEVARFIKAITNQSYTNIYNLVCNRGDDPKTDIETRKKRLRTVKDKFYNLKSNLVNTIQNELERLERRNE